MDRSISTFRILVLCIALLLTACGGAATPAMQEAPLTGAEPLQNSSERGHSAPTPAAAVAPAELPATADNTDGFSTGGDAIPNGEPYDSTYYQNYRTNPFIDTE